MEDEINQIRRVAITQASTEHTGFQGESFFEMVIYLAYVVVLGRTGWAKVVPSLNLSISHLTKMQTRMLWRLIKRFSILYSKSVF